MNERIRELAIEARELADIEYAKRQTGYDLESILMQKFAELIVRECIGQCEKNKDHEWLGAGSKLCAFNIKQHFGVE